LLRPNQDPDLREFYITPEYLELLVKRARYWPVELVQEQISYFKFTIPEYPEVAEALESELFARELNSVVRAARRMTEDRLRQLLLKYSGHDEVVEIINTELEIRSGAERLTDKSESAD
jgi:hypothetical protein